MTNPTSIGLGSMDLLFQRSRVQAWRYTVVRGVGVGPYVLPLASAAGVVVCSECAFARLPKVYTPGILFTSFTTP